MFNSIFRRKKNTTQPAQSMPSTRTNALSVDGTSLPATANSAQTHRRQGKSGRRNHWYHSIRWRMALGSMCVTFFSTLILAVAVILAITYYYSRDQSNLLASFAADGSQRIGAKFIQDNFILAKAAADTYPNALEQNFQG